MKRIHAVTLALVLGLAGLFYAAGTAWTAQEKEKSCCADCCCCKADKDAKADKAGMACCMKHKK